MRLIDADELLIKLQWHCDLNCPYTKKQRDAMCSSCLLGDAKDYIDSMSTVDAEPIRHGHWEHGEDVFGMYCQCSECGNQYYGSYEFKYCPNCGAKMDEEEQA